MTTRFDKLLASQPDKAREIMNMGRKLIMGYIPGPDMFNAYFAIYSANYTAGALPVFKNNEEIMAMMNNKEPGWDFLYIRLGELRGLASDVRRIVNSMYDGTTPDKYGKEMINTCARAVALITRIMPGTKTEDVEEVAPEIKEKANKIVASGKVLDYIEDKIARTVIGNRGGIRMLVMTCSQRALENGNGVYNHLNGRMGGGKSHLVRTVLFYFPPEVVRDSGMSGKTLFYDNAEQSMIYYIDDFNGLDETTKSTLKNVLTNFRKDTEYRPVNKKNGENIVVSLKVKARTTVIFSSVDSIGDQQLMDRLVPLPTDTDPNTKKKVYEYYTKVDSGQMKDLDSVVDEEVQVCREVLRQLTCDGNLYRVVIPYLKEVEWPQDELSNTRNYGVFRDLIKLSALLARAKRPRDEEDNIVANYEDFYTALDVYAPSNERRTMMKTKMSEGPQRVHDFLASHNDENYTQAELVDRLKVSQASLSRWLETLKEMSAVAELMSGREYKNSYTETSRTLPVKVYQYKGDAPTGKLTDHPIQLSEKCRSSPEYKTWEQEYLAR